MKILNFGSLNLDIVYSVDSIVRPGETISSLKMERFCGGKGLNQSIALARAGAEVYHAGCIGPDGDILKQLLSDSNVDTSLIKAVEGASGHAIIQVDKRGQNCIILFGGANQKIATQYVDEVLSYFAKGDILLLQNEINELPYIMEKAYEKGMEIALNPSPFNEKIEACPLQNVTYFIINEIEGEEISGKSESIEIINEMKKLYPKSKTVLTLGKHGVVYSDGEQEYKHGIYDVKVIDTTAAGDTFLGYFVANIKGNNPDEVLRLASIASSLAVSVKGAANSIPFMKDVVNANLKAK
ncbi:MAG: ribokinase [Oscillospiraceae bacterium]|nr:ribokinase [Oscillospiraceae bacterium]